MPRTRAGNEPRVAGEIVGQIPSSRDALTVERAHHDQQGEGPMVGTSASTPFSKHRELAALTDVRGCCSSSPLAHVDDACLAWRPETPEAGSTDRRRNRISMKNLGFTVAAPDTSDAKRLSRPVWPRAHGRSPSLTTNGELTGLEFQTGFPVPVVSGAAGSSKLPHRTPTRQGEPRSSKCQNDIRLRGAILPTKAASTPNTSLFLVSRPHVYLGDPIHRATALSVTAFNAVIASTPVGSSSLRVSGTLS
ncbi:hypothetical protein QBC34DRAFT_216130 [Podospora aff. communis PSN243]|uniref:Uncharacterized protein n=1 Tax=Podospora aff. communis PSN243 TaxID=3040156 RepID=A0AAV9GZD6_9PEZI|nr:hypothetical protein QBC34DRAFT_216130 [Podospora aff. communis PSN243]